MTTTTNPVNEYYAIPDTLNGATGPRWLPVNPDGLPAHVRIKEGAQVSSKGEIRSAAGRKLGTYLTGNQLYVSLRWADRDQSTSIRVDRLVLSTFTRPAKEGEQPRHLDGNTLNCELSNLVWATDVTKDESKPGKKSVPQKKATTKAPKALSRPEPEITMTRTYSVGNVKIAVDEDGALVYMDPAPGFLTPGQTMMVCRLLAKVYEMNHVMGVQ